MINIGITIELGWATFGFDVMFAVVIIGVLMAGVDVVVDVDVLIMGLLVLYCIVFAAADAADAAAPVVSDISVIIPIVLCECTALSSWQMMMTMAAAR